MSRGIEFRHYSNAPQPSVVDDLLDVVQGIYHRGMIRSLGGQFRVAGTLIRKAVVVNDVPMKNVHFVIRHRVQSQQYVEDRQVMARRVQEETPMG